MWVIVQNTKLVCMLKQHLSVYKYPLFYFCKLMDVSKKPSVTDLNREYNRPIKNCISLSKNHLALQRNILLSCRKRLKVNLFSSAASSQCCSKYGFSKKGSDLLAKTSVDAKGFSGMPLTFHKKHCHLQLISVTNKGVCLEVLLEDLWTQ